MSIKHLFADDRPNVSLNFAGSKTLDGRITFTRSTTATYSDDMGRIKTAAAGEGRIDHSGTGDCLGLLIEEQRTNVLKRSESMWHSDWSDQVTGDGGSATQSGTDVDPSGNNNALKIVSKSSASGYHAIYQNGSLSNSTTYTFSVYAKANGYNFIGMSLGSPCQTSGVFFNLSTGAVGTTNGSGWTPKITTAGNGWYRCQVTKTTNNESFPQIETHSADNQGQYTGDGSSGVLLWGAQCELGDFSTSYIPTTSSTVTRNKDVATIFDIDFYNEPSGTMISKVSYLGRVPGGALQAQWSFGGCSGNSQYGLKLIQYGFNQQYRTGGATAHHINPSVYAGTSTMTDLNAVGVAYATNDLQLTVNGSSAGSLTSGFSGPVGATRLDIGNYGEIAGNLRIRSLAYYNTRLSNTALEALTK